VAEKKRLVGDANSIRDARAMVRTIMSDQATEVRDIAVLLTDELVTNAVVHGGGRFELNAELGPRALRVVVSDLSPAAPRVLTPSADQEHGRGMAIVASLASAWGSDVGESGKGVWFSLDLTPPRSSE
jgi:anti-sigma regulatory factor (Ser/Thr protein kinase)